MTRILNVVGLDDILFAWDDDGCLTIILGIGGEPLPELCTDEGCPHFGTPHVCISRDDALGPKSLGDGEWYQAWDEEKSAFRWIRREIPKDAPKPAALPIWDERVQALATGLMDRLWPKQFGNIPAPELHNKVVAALAELLPSVVEGDAQIRKLVASRDQMEQERDTITRRWQGAKTRIEHLTIQIETVQAAFRTSNEQWREAIESQARNYRVLSQQYEAQGVELTDVRAELQALREQVARGQGVRASAGFGPNY
jgi:hypothetical protein